MEKGSEKRALIFDTNFIISHKNFKDVIKELKSNFSVYVTQVTIQERIAQKAAELEKDITDINNKLSKYRQLNFPAIKFDKRIKEEYCNHISQSYSKCFGDKIIPLTKDKKTFEKVLERAFAKSAPFSSNENASDKGFKDSLLWISILDYFRCKGEQEIMFLSNDNAFVHQKEILQNEFSSYTGKSIEIHSNDYYNKYMDEKTESTYVQKALPSVEQYRDKLEHIIEEICYTQEIDYWGNQTFEKTFATSVLFDNIYVESFLKNIKNIIRTNIFSKELLPSAVFYLDDRIADLSGTILITSLESLANLYDEIANKYGEYINAFYSAVASLLNQNYESPEKQTLYNDDLPF